MGFWRALREEPVAARLAGPADRAALAALLARTAVAAAGVDPSPTMLAAARRRLGTGADLRDVAIEALPFADGAFDAALALNVLYFAGHDGAMIRQLHRVLRPGGRLVAYVTHRDSMANWPFARQGVHRLFDGPQLASALAEGGFARERICVQEAAITASVTGLLAVAVKEP